MTKYTITECDHTIVLQLYIFSLILGSSLQGKQPHSECPNLVSFEQKASASMFKTGFCIEKN